MPRQSRFSPEPDAPTTGAPAGISLHRFVEALRTYLDMTAGKALTLEAGQVLTVLEDGIPGLTQVGEHQATVSYEAAPEEAAASLLAGRLGLQLTRSEGVDTLSPA